MPRRTLVMTLAVALAGLAGRALAQQPPPDEKKADVVEKKVELVEKKKVVVPGAPGRFAVAVSGETAVLLDTATGQTWVLRRTPGAAWVPAQKLDSDEAVREWLEREKVVERLAAEVELERQRARQAAERLEALRRQLAQPEGAPEVRQLQHERDRALRALEEAERRLRELEQKPK
jgi:hypothetical protein